MRGTMTVASKAVVKAQLSTAEATIAKALNYLKDGEDQLARDVLEGYQALPEAPKPEKVKKERKPRAKKTETVEAAAETVATDASALN